MLYAYKHTYCKDKGVCIYVCIYIYIPMHGSIKGSRWVITILSLGDNYLSPSDNSVVKMGVISLRRMAVIVGNGMQTIFLACRSIFGKG